MKNKLLVQKFGNRMICIRGIGKLFYQNGYPISLAVSDFKKMNIEVSLLHVADECLKHGWSAYTTYSRLVSDFEEDISKNNYDLNLMKKFCYADYDEQRRMIFNYLYGPDGINSDIFSDTLLRVLNYKNT